VQKSFILMKLYLLPWNSYHLSLHWYGATSAYLMPIKFWWNPIKTGVSSVPGGRQHPAPVGKLVRARCDGWTTGSNGAPNRVHSSRRIEWCPFHLCMGRWIVPGSFHGAATLQRVCPFANCGYATTFHREVKVLIFFNEKAWGLEGQTLVFKLWASLPALLGWDSLTGLNLRPWLFPRSTAATSRLWRVASWN
jgi:hypothetical protein